MKTLLVLIGNPSQHGFFERFAKIFETHSAFQIVKFSIEDISVYARKRDRYPLTARIASIQPEGLGVKGWLKKILCRKNLRRALLWLCKTGESLKNTVERFVVERRQHSALHAAYAALEEKHNIAAYILPSMFETAYGASVLPRSRPIIAVPSYARLPASAWVNHASTAEFQTQYPVLHKLIEIIVPHWRCRDASGRLGCLLHPAYLLIPLFCGIRRKEDLGVWRRRLAGAAIPSEWQKNVWSEYGDVPEAWPILGDLDADTLFHVRNEKARRKEQLFSQAGFLHEKTVVFDGTEKGADFIEVLVEIALFAQKNGWNVMCCPHPGVLGESAREKFTAAGIFISPWPTVEALPLADLYVAGCSSTCIWAAQLGLPTISYIPIGDSVGFDKWEGCLAYAGGQKDGFIKSCYDILTHSDLYQDLLGMAQKDPTCFGAIDGKSGQRIREYIESLLGKP